MNATIAAVPPIIWTIGRLCVAAVLFVLIWIAADGAQIMRTLRQTNLALLCLAVGGLLVQTVLSAWRWKVTAARLGQTFSGSQAVREYFISQAVNQALPGGVVGDAARAVRARADVGLGVSGLAVGLERLAGQIAMLVTFACAFAVTTVRPGGLDWPDPLARTIACVILGMMIAGLMCAAFRGMAIGANPGRAHWLRKAGSALLSRDVLPAQIGLGLAITFCNLGALGLCAWAIGAPLSIGALCGLVPLVLFSMLVPITISGWGVREGSAALLLPIAGMLPSQAVATSVLFGVAMLLSALPGLILTVQK